jgi:non-specific serine/threonine protein kinase
MAAGAPPIPNGEYLTPDAVRGIWQALSEWTSENLGRESPGEFLAARAPLWKRVGRVVFLLAELKGNAQKPFAFTATFLDSLTDDGRYRHILLSAALTRYKDTRPALLKILTPVREAAARLTCIAEMLEDGTLYKSCAWTAREDHRFLLGIPDMEESGLVVSVPNWWRKRPKAPVRVQIGQGKKRLFSGRMRSLTLTSRPPLAGWR